MNENKNMEEFLFEEMAKAIYKANELELQATIARREADKLSAAYRAYCNAGKGGVASGN